MNMYSLMFTLFKNSYTTNISSIFMRVMITLTGIAGGSTKKTDILIIEGYNYFSGKSNFFYLKKKGFPD